jgi:obg-like ATPase 1
MVRAFENRDVTHVEDSVDPIRDMEIIHEELRLKDLTRVTDMINAQTKNVERGVGGKEKKAEYEILQKIQAVLEEGKDIRAASWNNAEVTLLNTIQFLTAKPMIYLVNLTKRSFYRRASNWLPRIMEFVEARGLGETIIPFSVAYEQELLDLEQAGDEGAINAFYEECQGVKGVLPRIIKAGYKLMRLINFFTVGPDEVRAWTIRNGWLAPKAAGVIHTDFEHGFICADTITFKDFKAAGSEAAVKAAGKLKQQGKGYVVQDGDIIHFKFNN